MTIDKLIADGEEFIKHASPYNCDQYEEAKMQLQCLYELKWWRKQDLIKREDVFHAMTDPQLFEVLGNKRLYKPSQLVIKISEIPTAEPPHATVDERNGDCETCKHYDTNVCEECYVRYDEKPSKYEPYTP